MHTSRSEEIFLDARRGLPCRREEWTTRPYPGFPTDLQSALLSAMTVAQGRSEIEENIFEARFQTADQLRRMGADLEIKGNRARIRGVSSLHGTFVRAKELRGGAALVLAALGAEGTTLIQDDGYIGERLRGSFEGSWRSGCLHSREHRAKYKELTP